MKINCFKNKRNIITMCLFFFGLVALGQQTQINGTVLSEADGQPLPGASILVKESSLGTTTDFDGKFQIKAKEGEILIVSYYRLFGF